MSFNKNVSNTVICTFKDFFNRSEPIQSSLDLLTFTKAVFYVKLVISCVGSETYTEPCQTYKMEIHFRCLAMFSIHFCDLSSCYSFDSRKPYNFCSIPVIYFLRFVKIELRKTNKLLMIAREFEIFKA